MFYANRPDPWAKWSLLDNKHPFDLRAHVANVGVSISPGQHQNERSGDPGMGNYGDATILKSFGEVPENLDEL